MLFIIKAIIVAHRIRINLTTQMQACRMGLFRKGVHMAFEEFTKKKSRGSTELKVSISRAGLFILNSASVNQHFKGFDYVVLLWEDRKSTRLNSSH